MMNGPRRRRHQQSCWTLTSLIAVCTILGIVSFLRQADGQLRLGKAVNIFIRYGYLSISMKVISYNDTETWLFKEPTINIFKVSVLQ